MSRRAASILSMMFAIALIAACGPRMPTAEGAQAAYRARKALIDRVDRSIAEAVDRIPGVDTSRFACATEPSEQCMRERAEQSARQVAASRAFAHDVLPSIARGTEILGIRVEYAQNGIPRGHLGVLEADSAGGRIGSVQAGRGVVVDGRQLGWGLYQTSWQRGSSTVRHGDGKYHPGIEVLWTQEHGNARITIRMVLLVDGWRRPEDWESGS
jgi:hypothetical protein